MSLMEKQNTPRAGPLNCVCKWAGRFYCSAAVMRSL